MPGQNKTLEDHFLETLKDMYYAERKILVALPKMAKVANSDQLRAAFKKHAGETEGQVQHLQQVFKMMKQAPKGKTCPAILGLVEEGEEVMRISKILRRWMRAFCRAPRRLSITKYRVVDRLG